MDDNVVMTGIAFDTGQYEIEVRLPEPIAHPLSDG